MFVFLCIKTQHGDTWKVLNFDFLTQLNFDDVTQTKNKLSDLIKMVLLNLISHGLFKFLFQCLQKIFWVNN